MRAAPKWGVWASILATGALAGLAIANASWFQFAGNMFASGSQESAALNFRITAEYEIEGVRYRGDAVWEMRTWIAKFPTTGAQQFEVRGEAFALTGGDRNLYVLRREQPIGSGLGVGYFPDYCVPRGLASVSEAITWLREVFTGPCEVSQLADARLPMLVEIPDLADPSSTLQLPYKALGPGTSCTTTCLRSLTVERTSEQATRGIENRLEWLGDYTYGLTDISTHEAASSGRGVGDGFMLTDFSTFLGNGRMYKP